MPSIKFILMKDYKKRANTYWFEKIISSLHEGGVYFWPDANENFTMKEGKFYGSKLAIRKIKSITSTSFHEKLIEI
jgi:hypothetical protein